MTCFYFIIASPTSGVFCSFSQSQFGHPEIISEILPNNSGITYLILETKWFSLLLCLLSGGLYKAGSGSTRE